MSFIDNYRKRLDLYLNREYWARVYRHHGSRGVRREILRIITPFNLSTPVKGRVPTVGVSSPAGVTDSIDALPTMTLPIEALRRDRIGISIADAEVNPYTKSVAEYFAGTCMEYKCSAAKHFLETWQPRTLAEFVGVAPTSPDSPLNSPFIIDILPWEQWVPPEEQERRRDAYELGLLLKLGKAPGRHGFDYCGPTSDILGSYRHRKHCHVAVDIQAHGLIGQHRIDVQLLIDSEQMAAIVKDGKHRTTALALLGVPTVDVYVPPGYQTLRREDVETWPGVIEGVYSVEEALLVFDRFLRGAPPWA